MAPRLEHNCSGMALWYWRTGTLHFGFSAGYGWPQPGKFNLALSAALTYVSKLLIIAALRSLTWETSVILSVSFPLWSSQEAKQTHLTGFNRRPQLRDQVLTASTFSYRYTPALMTSAKKSHGLHMPFIRSLMNMMTTAGPSNDILGTTPDMSAEIVFYPPQIWPRSLLLKKYFTQKSASPVIPVDFFGSKWLLSIDWKMCWV